MHVYRFDDAFPYKAISTSTPRPLQGGGAFHSSLHIDGSEIRIQLPECSTKAGIVTTKRGGHVDLLYEVDKHDDLIEALEKLEQTVAAIVSSKKELWFTNDISEEDIESMNSPLVRTYRAGRFFILRVNIARERLANGGSFVFNEKGVSVPLNEIMDCNRRVIPLIVLEGLKYTSRSITTEFSAVQIMVCDNAMDMPCLISSNPTGQPKDMSIISGPSTARQRSEESLASDTAAETSEPGMGETPKSESCEIPKSEAEVTSSSSLKEITVEASSGAVIELRKQEDVYRDLYDQAYSKARRLRGAAIEAYANAKEMKQLYNIETECSLSEFESDGTDTDDV
tara:strand:- start:14070 stop:15089 length:1020 start_codon:yes stop_codon:yes gene_type:complete